MQIIFILCLIFYTSKIKSAEYIQSELPEIVCNYEMTVLPYDKISETKKTKQALYLWRTQKMLQVFSSNLPYAEVWLQSPNQSIEYLQLYHTAKLAIEYPPAEQAIHGKNFDWIKLTHILGQAELNQFKTKKLTHYLGRSAQIMTAKISGQKPDLIWLKKENIPAKLILFMGQTKIQLKLVEIKPLKPIMWPLITLAELSQYRRIDAADIGDMQTDPNLKSIFTH